MGIATLGDIASLAVKIRIGASGGQATPPRACPTERCAASGESVPSNAGRSDFWRIGAGRCELTDRPVHEPRQPDDQPCETTMLGEEQRGAHERCFPDAAKAFHHGLSVPARLIHPGLTCVFPSFVAEDQALEAANANGLSSIVRQSLWWRSSSHGNHRGGDHGGQHHGHECAFLFNRCERDGETDQGQRQSQQSCPGVHRVVTPAPVILIEPIAAGISSSRFVDWAAPRI